MYKPVASWCCRKVHSMNGDIEHHIKETQHKDIGTEVGYELLNNIQGVVRYQRTNNGEKTNRESYQ